MAQPPSAPVIINAPNAETPNQLEYTWYPPSNFGSPAIITGYRLTVNPGNLVYTMGPVTNYVVTGLTNAQTYSATIEATNDGLTYGPPASFMDFQPGSPPAFAPSTVTATSVGNDSANITWTPPISLPDAQIFWYYIEGRSTNPADPIISTNGWAQSQSNVFIRGLNSNSFYTFNVQAVNCPGYSSILSTSTIRWDVPFRPFHLPAIRFWYDAQDSNTIVGPETSVTQWNDKSSNNFHMRRMGPSTIFYTQTGLNTYPSIFLSSFAGMSTNSFIFSQSNQITYFTVLRQTAVQPTGSGNAEIFASATDYRTLDLLSRGTAPNDIRLVQGNTTENATGVNITNQNIILGFANTSTGSLLMNGSTAMTYVPGNQFFLSTTQQYLMGFSKFTGHMGEMLAYSNLLTPFNRQKVEGYLGWKWGLQSNLPLSHPFRNTLPLSNSVFTPPLFSSLQLWLDGSDPTGTGVALPTGGNISTIIDKSGNLRHASTLIGAAVQSNSINSLGTLYFAGTNFYNVGYTNFPRFYTIFTVYKSTSNTGTYQRLVNSATDQYLFIGTNISSVATFVGNGAWNDTNTNTPAINAITNYNIVSLVNNGVTLAPFVTGSNQNTKTATTGTFNNLILGRSPSSTQPFWGNFGEMLVYDRALTSDDRQTVEGWLAWKWGLQGFLPLSHPYSSNNPGVVSTVTSFYNGLRFGVYSGYFADNTTFFDNRTAEAIGSASNFVDVGTGTAGYLTPNGRDSYSVQWIGYFLAPTTGSYTFYTVSDDASYLWIGASAVSGYTTGNALVNNGGEHGMNERSGTITLTAGIYYDMRVQFGENGGGDDINISVIPPGGSRIYNLTGYVYNRFM